MYPLIRAILGFSLRNRVLVLIATVVLIALGFMSYQSTPLEAFPDVTNTRVQIITQWPGRSAEEVERFITINIEAEMNGVPDKTSLRSISLFGLSVVTMLFEDHVTDATARQAVAQRLAGLNLPEGAEAEMQPSTGPTGEIYRYTLSSKQKSPRELKTLQDWVIERKLKGVPGVADVVSFGGEVRTFEVSADPNAMMQYDITADELYKAVTESNVNVGGDVIVKSQQAYVVRGIGVLNDISEIENIIVASHNDAPILVRHVAHVSETCLPLLGYVGRDSTTNLVQGIVLMRRGENPSAVLSALRDRIDDLNANVLPADVRIVPFYDRTDLINTTTKTVTDNLWHGMVLVIIIVLAFMLDIRTTLIVAMIIPLALLFAFMCLRMMGMSANLLSLGAIDFGIIIDGTVVMVEGLFVLLDHKAHQLGLIRYRRLGKLGLIRRGGAELGKAVFFSKAIILAALIPIFTLQKVEGKMFAPLAFILSFALLGALFYTLTLVPALMSFAFDKSVKERRNPLVVFLNQIVMWAYDRCHRRRVMSVVVSVLVLMGSLGVFLNLGTEFLPQLNEGAVYIRASLPMSTSLDQSIEMAERIRKTIGQFPEVRKVMSQTGRPNDGTDPTGFFNCEFHVDLHPKDLWTRGLRKEELIAEMKEKLSAFQGVSFNFSQPIMDNVEEAVSGVKGSMAVKVYAQEPDVLNAKAEQIYQIMSKIKGVEDLGIIGISGQPELRIELDQQKMAYYGVSTAEAQAVIELAIGGKAATYLYEGERKFPVRVRYQPAYRNSDDAVANLMIPNIAGSKVPLKNLAHISNHSGLAFLYRENNSRFIAVKFSVRGRDLGSTIAEAQAAVAEQVPPNKSYKIAWNGEFENQIRATNRLAQTIPLTIVFIFMLLYIYFGSVPDALLTLVNVPFALIGGIVALWLTDINFSISAGIGFVALSGICIQNGVILTSVFKKNIQSGLSLADAVRTGVVDRVRPVVMTAMIAAFGLVPAALSTGIGSESQKPLAVVIIGGLVSATVLTLLVSPLIFELVYARILRRRQAAKW